MSARAPAGGRLAVLIMVVVLTAAGCGSSSRSARPARPARSASTAGPVRLVRSGGQPSLTNASIVSVLGVPADGMVTVINHAAIPVRITSAVPVPVPAAPAPVLAQAGVEVTDRAVAAAYGWPLGGVLTVPAVGAQLRPGESNVIYGLTGNKPGRYYAIAGLRFTYSYRGRTYALVAWSGFTACFTASAGKHTGQCGQKDRVSAAVNQDLEKMAWHGR